MLNIIPNILLSYISNCLLDQRLVAVLDEPGQLLSPQIPELRLDLAEDELNGVVLGGVGQIEDVPDSELAHMSLCSVRRVHGEVVHEEAELLAWVGLRQVCQVLLELLRVDGVLVDVEQLVAFLLADSMQE